MIETGKTMNCRGIRIRYVGKKLTLSTFGQNGGYECRILKYQFVDSCTLICVCINNKKLEKKKFDLREWDYLDILGERIYDRMGGNYE